MHIQQEKENSKRRICKEDLQVKSFATEQQDDPNDKVDLNESRLMHDLNISDLVGVNSPFSRTTLMEKSTLNNKCKEYIKQRP